MLCFCPVAVVCTCMYHNDLEEVDEANCDGFEFGTGELNSRDGLRK
jgi:hypothetical protein